MAALTTITSFRVLSATYGVGSRTIGRHRKDVKDFVGPMWHGTLGSNPDGVRKVQAAMRAQGKLHKMGGARFLSDEEEKALIMGINTAQSSVGAGMHRVLSRAVFLEDADHI